MIKDITLGQYFPGDSPVHRLDARVKLVLTLAFITALFMVTNAAGYLLMLGFLVIAVKLSRIPLKLLLRGLKPLVYIIIFTAVLNVFYGAGNVVFAWKFLKITDGGIRNAVMMMLRIVFLIIGTSLLTYTTSPIMLTDAIERLLGPLKKIKVPVHELAMMMSIALRFIPTLIEETDKIMNAQKARGADFESGNLFARMRALIPILVPLFVSAFRRADELAIAMECRCYNGGEGRTRLKQLKTSVLDLYAGIAMTVVIVLVVVLNIML